MGSCTAYDILASDPSHMDKFSTPWTNIWNGSMCRSMISPGKIAERLLNDMGDSSKYPMQIRRQIDAVTKFHNPEELLKDAPPNTVVMIDLGYETIDYFINEEGEEFDIRPSYPQQLHVFPEWFNSVLKTGWTRFDSDNSTTMNRMRWGMQELLASLHRYKFPIVFLGNASTPYTYLKELNSVATTISAFNKRVPFMIHSGHGDNVMLNFEYANRVIEKCYSIVKNHITDKYPQNKHWVWFDLQHDQLFSDPDHPYGYHPVHLHYLCRKLLVDRLHSTIIDLHTEHNSKPII